MNGTMWVSTRMCVNSTVLVCVCVLVCVGVCLHVRVHQPVQAGQDVPTWKPSLASSG